MAQHCAYEDETNNVRKHIQLVNALCKKEEINVEINDDKRFLRGVHSAMIRSYNI